MKKILTVLISLSFVTSPVFAVIRDDFADSTIDKSLKIRTYAPTFIVDEFAESNTKHSAPRGVVVITEDTDKNCIKIHSKERITTKSKPAEGSEVFFVTGSDAKINNRIYPAGTPVKARIETVSMNTNWGVPAEIVIGNFSIEEVPLAGEISKTGKNKTFWVRPLACAGCIFFGAGFFFMFIKGGHAKIKPDEMFTVSF